MKTSKLTFLGKIAFVGFICLQTAPTYAMMARVHAEVTRTTQHIRQALGRYRNTLFSSSQRVSQPAILKNQRCLNSQLSTIAAAGAGQQKIDFPLLAPWMLLTGALITTVSESQSKEMEVKAQTTPLSFDEAVTILYACELGCFLYSSQELAECKNVSELKQLVKKYKLIATNSLYAPKEWNEQNWNDAYKDLCTYQNEENFKRERFKLSQCLKISVEQVPQLLDHTLTALKPFIPIQPISRKDLEEKYIKKRSTLRRLYTYTKLQLVIQKKQLQHVRLPKKILLVWDKEKREYLWGEEALAILQDLLHVYLWGSQEPSIMIDYKSDFDDRYDLFVYAQRELSHKPFNKAALEELIELIREAPFDVGHDNIFADKNGDAVIIDTEYKQADAPSCIAALVGRYTTTKQFQEFKELYKKNGHYYNSTEN